MTTKGAILKAVREHCLSCCNGSTKEVDLCRVGNNATSTIGICQLHPYRLGKDPVPSRKGRFKKTPTTESGILRDDNPMVQCLNSIAGRDV